MIRRPARRRERPSASRTLVRDTSGASYVEYLILAGVVALLSLQAFTGFAGKVDTTLNQQMLDPAKMGL
jgi:Flp pilus assembly pilin Flp